MTATHEPGSGTWSLSFSSNVLQRYRRSTTFTILPYHPTPHPKSYGVKGGLTKTGTKSSYPFIKRDRPPKTNALRRDPGTPPFWHLFGCG